MKIDEILKKEIGQVLEVIILRRRSRGHQLVIYIVKIIRVLLPLVRHAVSRGSRNNKTRLDRWKLLVQRFYKALLTHIYSNCRYTPLNNVIDHKTENTKYETWDTIYHRSVLKINNLTFDDIGSYKLLYNVTSSENNLQNTTITINLDVQGEQFSFNVVNLFSFLVIPQVRTKNYMSIVKHQNKVFKNIFVMTQHRRPFLSKTGLNHFMVHQGQSFAPSAILLETRDRT